MIPRYALPRMVSVWEPQSRYAAWLRIELLACEAWADLGVVPREALAVIQERAGFDINRIQEIEREVRHDVIAFVSAVAERVGPEARYLHFGLTSYDVVDTALAVLLQQASGILLEDLEALSRALADLARRYKRTMMIGRTHGIHAEPTTFGLKLALWYCEVERNLDRLRRARESVAYGKLSGAVGTFAHLPLSVEQFVCARLGLKPAPISSQILSRDRHAEFLQTLALIGTSLDKFATEIRHLQRTEVREVEEPFVEGQKGSSAMPHKRNPVACEQVSGLARLLRSYAQSGLENVPLWHERDISHSSVERVILPDATILLDYLLVRFREVLEGLRVYPDRMRHNLELTGGLVFSEAVLLALIGKGLTREAAYRLVQGHAMRAWESGDAFKPLLLADSEIRRHLSPDEIESCFDLGYHLRHLDDIFTRVGL
ncbi:adenylosuccinate lyase [Candidatus Methylomirabilis lanthanidiphila]|uniref:Adenylosuccinate lyase n=1 Tax=Candidatus Methylomirabilis lanthanidiphila TaxID=2211376 RepID=A0A564ZH13_9BACT|nr:adenylosuccinate lyase [Candidatus Methylomirabilis lanthanidiphila]VUZ84443.1 adenylosuccinate lyase [Candidatus Methylomirabilis lanthanidiphila]